MAEAYVYKSSWDFKLQIKPPTKKGLSDGAGGFSHLIEVPPVYVLFTNGTCVIDAAMSRQKGQPVEVLKEWLEATDGFNLRYWLADEIPQDKVADVVSRESKQKVDRGVRATKS